MHDLKTVSRFLVFAMVTATTPAWAQWTAEGTPATTDPAAQFLFDNQISGPLVGSGIVSDGAGGVIVTWVDGSSEDIYAQRFNAAGVPLWAPNGVAVCTASFSQYNPMAVSDAAGGAIVTWDDLRSGSYDIYAQRITAAGNSQWTANGVALCTAVWDQHYPKIIADGAGGAIVSWRDERALDFDLYAQRINGAGAMQWAVNGVAVNGPSYQLNHRMVVDGAGGAIIAWQNGFSGGGSADIYAQRINSAGSTLWPPGGLGISTIGSDQQIPAMISDGSGGAIIAWQDMRAGTNDIYAQRLSPSGAPYWALHGVPVCANAGEQGLAAYGCIASDGTGGAIVTWHDTRNGPHDIFAQRLNALGQRVWITGGLPVCLAASDQGFPTVVTDGLGGAVVVWHDGRSGPIDLYAQRVNSSGTVEWMTDGVLVSGAVGNQMFVNLVADGSGGAVAAWNDDRWGNRDVYVQRIETRYGYWGRPEPALSTVADVPADQGGKVSINWYASGREDLNEKAISHYSIWRATDLAAQSSATVSLADVRAGFSGPALRVERTPSVDYFWELVGTQDAIARTAYTFTASTNFDSTSSGAATHQFQIVAHAAVDFYLNWPSNVMSGHSVDNLAPAAPLMLTAMRVGDDVQLAWNGPGAPDLRDYAIYRAGTTGVTPVPVNFLATSTDTVLVDSNAPVSALYYVVTAYDVHENQSAASNEANVGATTGVGNLPSITALTVLQNRPNPFGSTTDLSIGLPSLSDIAIEVYDVAGRRVRTVEVKGANAGWKTVPFAGVDDGGRPLASGVYFYRVTAAGSTVTRKMVITR